MLSRSLKRITVTIDDAHAHAKTRQLTSRRETDTASSAGDYRAAPTRQRCNRSPIQHVKNLHPLLAIFRRKEVRVLAGDLSSVRWLGTFSGDRNPFVRR